MTKTGRREWLRGLMAALCAAPLLAGAPAAAQDANYPNKRLNWTIAFGPGGGNDIMSRTLIDIIEKHKLYPNDIVAENRAGGSGAVGWGYLFGQKGNPYHISSTSGSRRASVGFLRKSLLGQARSDPRASQGHEAEGALSQNL